ncbi:MAG: phenylacetic acid degradation protein PaaY [Rhodospirillum sp.]|nr:phenylacetic acid degradation protein PaaY [Rhodospirillum sp.]MCF8492175.1 phenylacetic acid degradation protein PaaY [Rhodospirillum sp.]MCF8499529.1 phenylacetic acid degradation protein PaaY [Rhodospirillum sp.]
MKVYAIDGVVPVVHPEAFVHPTAVLIGDAIVGAGCYVGPGASMRGDFGRVQLEDGANLQDNCVMHGFPGALCVVRRNGHVGHGAILHGADVGEDALIGMNTVVLDNAVIGEGAIIAAQSLVKTKETVDPRSLWMGSPARRVRDLTEQELAWKKRGTEEYQELARRCLATLEEVAPLTEMPVDRPIRTGSLLTLHETRDGV